MGLLGKTRFGISGSFIGPYFTTGLISSAFGGGGTSIRIKKNFPYHSMAKLLVHW